MKISSATKKARNKYWKKSATDTHGLAGRAPTFTKFLATVLFVQSLAAATIALIPASTSAATSEPAAENQTSTPDVTAAPTPAAVTSATLDAITSTTPTPASSTTGSANAAATNVSASAAKPIAKSYNKKTKPVANNLAQTTHAAQTSAAQQAQDIARIENYLNNLKSVSADFLQFDDIGAMRQGTIAIQRPGKMRVNYAAPSKDFIVADGSFVHIWDDEMQQQTNVPLGSSIAEFILRDPVKLNGDVTVTKFEKFPAKIELTLTATKEPANGALTLIFEDNPLRLRQWRVLDAQGKTTGVNLQNAREGVSFPSNTFDFIPPNFGGINNPTLRR